MSAGEISNPVIYFAAIFLGFVGSLITALIKSRLPKAKYEQHRAAELEKDMMEVRGSLKRGVSILQNVRECFARYDERLKACERRLDRLEETLDRERRRRTTG